MYIYIYIRAYIGFVAGCGVRREADRCVVAAGLERVSRRGEYSLAAAPPKHCAAAGYLRLAHAAGTSWKEPCISIKRALYFSKRAVISVKSCTTQTLCSCRVFATRARRGCIMERALHSIKRALYFYEKGPALI